MSVNREHKGSVTPNGSEVNCRPGRARSGLLAFLRPRQTVSPGPHHAHSDQHASLRDNKSQQEGPLDQAEDSHSVSTDWSNLPDHLVESVLRNLQSGESAPLHPENKSAKLSLFAATSVSRNWRHIGRRVFFQNLWDIPGSIRHPVQLFGLSTGIPNHLMKCVMKRENSPGNSGAVKYTLRLGDQFHNSTFLMAALQTSRLDIKMHLSSDCKGTPCARIRTNLLGTKYDVILDKTVQPFIQYERTHSHASGCDNPPLSPLGPLATLDSAGDLLSSRCHSWFDVPMLDSMTHQPMASHTQSIDLLDTNASLELNPALGDMVLQTQETIPEEAQVVKPHTPKQSHDTGGLFSSRSSRRRRRHETLAAAEERDEHVQDNTGFLQRCMSGIEGTALSIMDSMNFSGLLRSDGRFSSRQAMQSPFAPLAGGTRTPCSCETVPSNIGAVQYKTRARGFMRPRRMKVSLPDPSALACFDTTGLHRCCSASGPLAGQPGVLMASTSFVGQDFREPCAVSECSHVCIRRQRCYTKLAGVTLPVYIGTEESSGQMAPPPSTPPQPQSRSPMHLLSSSSSLWRSASSPVQSEKSSVRKAPQSPSVVLRNKAPHWNDTLRCWCLNFRGRVKLASVKNFQLVKANDPAKSIVMQFGKVDAYTYIMDYNPSEITAMQAFAISLSTFETKLLM